MSLSKPHPLWTSCSNNSYDVSRAVVQARILSGRYKTDRLTRYLLLHCPSLSHTRQKMSNFLHERTDFGPRTKSLIKNILDSQSVRDKVQLLLDCSCLPEVIANHQLDNQTMWEIFKFSRTWCYAVHAMRQKIMDTRKEVADIMT